MTELWNLKNRSSFCFTAENPTGSRNGGPRYDDYTTVAYWYLDHPDRLPFGLPSDRELVMT